MPEYDNTNTGVLFTNDKGDNPKRPDRKGSINIEGTDYWLSGWVREKDGKPYMQLKAERKEQQGDNQRRKMHGSDRQPSQHQQAKQNAYQPDPQDDGDDIPF